MPREGFAVICAVMALAVPSATAATSDISGTLAARSATAEGASNLNAILLALYRLDQEGTGGDVSFDLHAAEVDVHTYSSDPAVSSGSGWIAPIPPGYEPEKRTFSNVEIVSSGQTKPGYKLAVVADGHAIAHVKSACLTFTEPDRGEFEAPPVVGIPTEPVATDVSNSIHWITCGGSSVEVVGDFVVSAFQVDAVLTAGDHTEELRSGYGKSTLIPDPAGDLTQGTAGEMRQQYVYVRNGRMTFAMDSTPHFAYIDSPSAETNGFVSFANAVGEVGRGAELQPVQASLLSVAGEQVLLTPRSGGQSKPLSVQVEGVESATADGQPLAFTVAPGTPGSPWNWSALLVVGLVAVPAAILVPLLRARARHRHSVDTELAQDLTNRDNHEAEPLVSAWANAEPSNPEALECLATILARRGQLRSAWQHRQQAEQVLTGSPALRWLRSENLLESAVLARRLSMQAVGQEQKDWMRHALRCLHGAVQLQPDLRHEADRHPDLRAIASELDDADDWLTP